MASTTTDSSVLSTETRASSSSATLVHAHAWAIAVWIAVCGWTATLFALVRSDYLGFRLARFDLGNMVQAVWSTAHGRPLETTLLSGEQGSRLASHVDPILALFAPLWLLWPSPLLLAFVQIAACASGALPVFWLARTHLHSERVACLLALAYLAYPWLAWTALHAMHPVTLAIPLFLYAIWFLDQSRLRSFAFCALLVLMTGELMGIPLAALGLWYWLARGRRHIGLTIAAAGAAWTAVCLKVVVPAFRDAGSPFYDLYGSIGGSPLGVLETAVTDPAAIVSALLSADDLSYLLSLSLPLLGLFLLAPGLALVALPQLIVNGLSDLPATTDPRHHYLAAVLPFLFGAAILGIGRLSPTRQTSAVVAVLVMSIALSAFFGPLLAIGRERATRFHPTYRRAHVIALRAAIALVPDGAPVSATNRVGSHLAARRHAYVVPTLGSSEWVVLDTSDAWMPLGNAAEYGVHPGLLRALRADLAENPDWLQVFAEDGVLVFRRVGA